jgi:sugar/nucleoside kinase (ribokinase family)
MKYDVLSLGPVRMDVFVGLPEEEVTEVCSMDKKRCMIELGFGEKIAVKSMTFAVGGNAGNNAVGVTRLGLKAALVGAVGDGWTDKQAVEILRSEGVETKYVEVKPGQMGFGVVINYQGERTILSYYSHSICCWPEDTMLLADWVYLTSMGEGYEDFYKQAVEWAKSHGARIAFNPGTRQLKAGLEHLRYAYEGAEVLFVNREEAALLLQGNLDDQAPTTNIKELLAGLRDAGPKVVVITDGGGGSYAYDGQKYLYMPIVPATVVERTGAGDAFGSGFLAAYISGKPIEECLKWGTVNSASVLGFVGPQAGLLTPEKMEKWLERNKVVQVERMESD